LRHCEESSILKRVFHSREFGLSQTLSFHIFLRQPTQRAPGFAIAAWSEKPCPNCPFHHANDRTHQTTSKMPFRRKDAPPTVPDCETIEYLLGAPNKKSRATRAVKPFDENSKAQKRRKNLVRLGERCTQIPGDPFGLWPSWTGNIAHPKDGRMVCVHLLPMGLLGTQLTSDFRPA
jgi:hypothetical protein